MIPSNQTIGHCISQEWNPQALCLQCCEWKRARHRGWWLVIILLSPEASTVLQKRLPWAWTVKGKLENPANQATQLCCMSFAFSEGICLVIGFPLWKCYVPLLASRWTKVARKQHQLSTNHLLLRIFTLLTFPYTVNIWYQLGPFDRAFSAQLELSWLITLANGAPASARMCSRLPGREGSSGSLRRKSMKPGGKEFGVCQVIEDKLFWWNSSRSEMYNPGVKTVKQSRFSGECDKLKWSSVLSKEVGKQSSELRMKLIQCRVVWKFTAHNHCTCESILHAGWCGSFLQRVVVMCAWFYAFVASLVARSQNNGCINVAWRLSWAGSRSTKPCVFPCKAAAGDERYLLCASGADLVRPRLGVVRTVTAASMCVCPFLHIAVAYVLEFFRTKRIVMAAWMLHRLYFKRKPEHETVCFSV